MCWQCDNPDLTTEDYFADVRETIRRHGWMVQYVRRRRTPFAYTIDFMTGFPRLSITGRFPAASTRLLNTWPRDAVAGKNLTPGQQIKSACRTLIEIVEMSHPDAHLNSQSRSAARFGGAATRLGRRSGALAVVSRVCDGRRKQTGAGVRSEERSGVLAHITQNGSKPHRTHGRPVVPRDVGERSSSIADTRTAAGTLGTAR